MKAVRSRFRAGYITVPEKFSVPDIYWKDGLDYGAFDKQPESFKWWLSCMGFLRLVCTSDRLSETDEATCRLLITDWYGKNPQDNAALSRSWDGHAVALRTETFVAVFQRCNDNSWLRPILHEQMSFLADEAHFQGNWNHGVDQAKALVVVSSCLADDERKSLGLERLRKALSAVVDAEGVTIEQAIHYQLYNYRQIAACMAVFEEHGIRDPGLTEVARRGQLMPQFLAHATKPDGTYFEIGDTPWQRATAIPGTCAEYAATGGASGPVPEEAVRVYSAGYIFGRSGWGEARPLKDESAYAVRFGPARNVHGHNDHLSICYHGNGQDILRDGGFHGYTDDDTRAFLRAAEAHNCIVPANAQLRFRGCRTELTDSLIRAEYQQFRLSTQPYDGVTITRCFFITFSPDVLIVLDRVNSTQPHAFEQRWLFGDGVSLHGADDGACCECPGLFEFKQHLPFDDMLISNPANGAAKLTVAGRAMYELKACSSLHTIGQGREVTFLSSFAFGPENDRAEVLFRPSRQGQEPDGLSILAGGRITDLHVLNDGRLAPA